jgi:hypothetical protein
MTQRTDPSMTRPQTFHDLDLWRRSDPLTAGDISDEVVGRVEAALGAGSGAWDMLDAREVIAAAWNEVRATMPAEGGGA